MSNRKIRILLADDQALFREGLHMVLATQPDFDIVGEASNGEEALQLATSLQPDIVLMDMRMPMLGGVEATRRLRAHQPACRVIILTTFDDDELVFEGLRAGAVGYLLKAVSSPRLLEAIRTVARGDSILGPSITAKVVAEFTRLANQAPTHKRWLTLSRNVKLQCCGWLPRVQPTARSPLHSIWLKARSGII